MGKVKPLKSISLCPIMILLLFISSCGSATPTVGVTYKPPFVPVTFTIDSNGTISVQGNLSITTPLGTFGLEANAAATLQPQDNALLLIIRHKKNGSLVDDVYKIETGQDEVIVTTNGTTTLDVTQHKVFIDTSKGSIQTITVEDANSQNTSGNLLPTFTAIPSPTPVPSMPSLFQGTIYEDQNATTYQVALKMTKTYVDGRFDGKWFAVINGVQEAVFVQGVQVPFDESSRFSQVNQDKAQQVQQQYGSAGTLVWFVSTSYASGHDIWLGCEYYGLLQTDGSVQGLWYPPGSDTDGGTFQVASTS